MPNYRPGLHTHRLSREPQEAVFAKQWEVLCRGQHLRGGNRPSLLSTLLDPGDGQNRDFEPSVRDCEVAATVIQWLGSPCGGSWLEDTLQKAALKEAQADDSR